MAKKIPISDSLLKAVKKVAKSVKGQDGKKTESDLVKMLQAHETDVDAAKRGQQLPSLDLAKVLVGMKVEKDSIQRDDQIPKKPRDSFGDIATRSRPIPLMSRPSRPSTQYQVSRKKINVLGSERLNIFEKDKVYEDRSILRTWKELQAEELTSLVTHPPKNAFEEMIRWTQQGKMWKYPIDNEAGLEAEQEVPFHEHVFLDRWLEGFDRRSAVGQFLEVICLALSKNPYITVQRKQETFDWFIRYFKEHEDILIRSGALGSSIEAETQPKTLPEQSSSA